eukprot:jgi/Botrbrau1/9402/Bobra.0252s0027.1
MLRAWYETGLTAPQVLQGVAFAVKPFLLECSISILYFSWVIRSGASSRLGLVALQRPFVFVAFPHVVTTYFPFRGAFISSFGAPAGFSFCFPSAFQLGLLEPCL